LKTLFQYAVSRVNALPDKWIFTKSPSDPVGLPKRKSRPAKRACNFWLEGELARDVKAPANFYERMRDICLLADRADDEALVIALKMFDDLILEIDPPQSWYDYKKRWGG
jgi:hypothetical protein